jgi:2-methylcitrate dehydratase
MKITLAEQLAQYAVGLKYEDLSAEAIKEVKRRVINSLGCALGALNEEPCVIARKVASRFVTTEGATLFGTNTRVPTDWAAFANGCLVRYFDYNDTYLSKEPAHPSDNIPAAIAVAEATGSTGKDLITAIVLAYEIQCRLADAASIRSRGWDHVTYGAFSTALAAAKLMKLDVEKTRQAVNIAGVASVALRQSRVGELSHWKGCAFGNAARHGVYAALLAREGMMGPAPIFEGEKGFEKLVSGPLSDFKLPTGDYGLRKNDFMILKTSIKYWPAEYHSQSAIEAALKLNHRLGHNPEIESVIVQSHDAAVDIIGSEPEKWTPTSRETADHSLPYIVAAALMDGEISSKQFESKRIADPELRALVQKVKVERHTELSAMYPGAVGNIVTVKLKDGTTHNERVDYPRGHAKNPMTDMEVDAKFHILTDPLLGNDRSKSLSALVWKLDDVAHMSELLNLTMKGGIARLTQTLVSAITGPLPKFK